MNSQYLGNYYNLNNDYIRCNKYDTRYKFGTSNEAKLKPKLEQFFGCDFTQKDRYAPFDFYGNKDHKEVQLELKTRKCKVNTYPTTFINHSKILKITDEETYFIFNFTDGVYYIKYDKDLFNTFEVKEVYTNNCDFSKGYRTNVLIPVSHLSPLTCDVLQTD